ncbi:MAG: hypothetical protein ACRDGM_01185 [bacterium]
MAYAFLDSSYYLSPPMATDLIEVDVWFLQDILFSSDDPLKDCYLFWMRGELVESSLVSCVVHETFWREGYC